MTIWMRSCNVLSVELAGISNAPPDGGLGVEQRDKNPNDCILHVTSIAFSLHQRCTQDCLDVARFGTRRHPHRDGCDHDLDGARANVSSRLALLLASHRHHRHRCSQPIRRQSEARSPDPVPRCCGTKSCRRATSAITAPGAIASATIRPFSTALHRRRRTTPVTSPRCRIIFVSSLMSTIMCTRSAIPTEPPSCAHAPQSTMWGQSTAYLVLTLPATCQRSQQGLE